MTSEAEELAEALEAEWYAAPCRGAVTGRIQPYAAPIDPDLLELVDLLRDTCW